MLVYFWSLYSILFTTLSIFVPTVHCIHLPLWCFWIVVLEKTLESPLDSKIKTVNPKGNKSWIFIGRTDAEAETPILWPPDEKTDSLEKTLMLERLKAWGDGDDRGWDGWMASPTQWAWVWASLRSWWWIGKPGMLQSMALHWTVSPLTIILFLNLHIKFCFLFTLFSLLCKF